MAEAVQEILDRMVAPLKDLEERNVFTSEEIAQIVQRRRTSEYRLPRKRCADYLEYIQSEVQLEELRKLRSKRLLRERRKQKTVSAFQSSQLGDGHIKHHIMTLWVRTLRNFNQIPLWLEYFKYLQSIKSYAKLSKAFGRCLALWPHATEVWIQAASHAYFQEQSMQQARVLLQRGIRVNPKSQDVWLQSMVLELHFAAKLQGRKAILTNKGDNDEEEDRGEETEMPEEEDPNSTQNIKDATKLAQIVYQGAVKAIPDDVDFRVECLRATRDFPNTQALQDMIRLSIRDTNSPVGWIALANWATEQGQDVEDILEQAMESLQTEEMLMAILDFVGDPNTLPDEFWGLADCVSSSRSLVLARARNVANQGRQQQAEDYLTEFLKEHPQDHEVWRQLAGIATKVEANVILKQGLMKVPLSGPGHVVLLLESLGCRLQDETMEELDKTLQKIIMLSSSNRIQFDPLFGIGSIADACLACLTRFTSMDSDEVTVVRRFYQKIIFQSSVIEKTFEDVDVWKQVFDMVLRYEMEQCDKSARQWLRRVSDKSIELFAGTPLETHFRQLKERITYGKMSNKLRVPSVDCRRELSDTLIDQFEKYRVVLLRNLPKRRCSLSWKDIADIFDNLKEADQCSWCVESSSGCDAPVDFLRASTFECCGYCSFLLQNDTASMEALTRRLPVSDIDGTKWSYEPAIWVFFGRNTKRHRLPGRPEHTDSVTHDGTWHYQLSGRKIWKLRPTQQLLEHMKGVSAWPEATVLEVDCQEGDVLVIDTRLWFHSTVIPLQDAPSVSYARDFCTDRRKSLDGGGMTNVDGMYAVSDIDAGTIIFTEKDMPDVEIHRSRENPNCEVVQFEDGTNAVVSTQDIPTGAFFALPESDSEESEY